MFEDLFVLVENGIDAHPRFERVRVGDLVHDPVMEVRRTGFEISILVKLKGSRKKPGKVWGRGDTAEEAARDLIRTLDFWAQAW